MDRHLEVPELNDASLWADENKPGSFLLYIPAMTCAACIWLLEQAVAGVQGVESARVNLDQRTIQMTLGPDYDHSGILQATIRKLQNYGYPPVPVSRGLLTGNQAARHSMINLGIAAAAFGNVMLFSTSIYFGDVWGIDPGMALFFNWWSFFISTASLVWPGRIFFQHALMSIRSLALHIDLPIALALIVAWSTSVFSLIAGGKLFYWDSITGLVFLLLVGRYVNDRITDRAKRLAGTAVSLLPPESAHCRPGEVRHVSVGQNFPADGKIVGGQTTVDESALTGEARAVSKHAGDRVLGGSRNLTGGVTFLVEAAGEGTWIRQLERKIEQASSERGRIRTMAEKILPWFTLATFALTILAGILWWPSGPEKAIEVMCVVLIVSCPCAVALATPLSMTIAIRRAWEHGAIIKGADCLERLARIDTVVLDKTGTLTQGAPTVTMWQASGNRLPPAEILSQVLAAASGSLHPVAKGLAAWLRDKVSAETLGNSAVDIQEVSGQGIIAESSVCTIIFGRETWVSGQISERGWTAGELLPQKPEACSDASTCFVAIRTNAAEESTAAEVRAMRFYLQDELHENSSEIVAQLSRSHQVWLLSGDNKSAARTVAKRVGISGDRVIAEADPEQKLSFINTLTAGKSGVLMVGDGINDAAALAAASVGIAVKGGVDVALNSADVFLTKPGLGLISDLVEYSRYTIRSLLILMVASIVYNLSAVSLALSGILHPGIAALIMPLASLTVLALVNLRKGEHLWKSSTSWCPLPSLSQASQLSVSSGQSAAGSSTI